MWHVVSGTANLLSQSTLQAGVGTIVGTDKPRPLAM